MTQKAIGASTGSAVISCGPPCAACRGHQEVDTWAFADTRVFSFLRRRMELSVRRKIRVTSCISDKVAVLDTPDMDARDTRCMRDTRVSAIRVIHFTSHIWLFSGSFTLPRCVAVWYSLPSLGPPLGHSPGTIAMSKSKPARKTCPMKPSKISWKAGEHGCRRILEHSPHPYQRS